MDNVGIEYRRDNAGGGNQMSQPYMQKHLNIQKPEDIKKLNMFSFIVITLVILPH